MLEGWKDVRAGEEVLCGWRASLNGRAQRGREQRVGRRFWARRFSPVERVFTGERVGPEGAERWLSHPSRLTREQGGRRGSPLHRAYKRAQPAAKSCQR